MFNDRLQNVRDRAWAERRLVQRRETAVVISQDQLQGFRDRAFQGTFLTTGSGDDSVVFEPTVKKELTNDFDNFEISARAFKADTFERNDDDNAMARFAF